MNLGQLVWRILAAALAIWILVTQFSANRLPTLQSIGLGFLGSWLGRAILLAGWAEMGWHLFCQHP